MENASARSRRTDQRDLIVTSLLALKPGDVIDVPAGKFAGIAVVIDPGAGTDRDGPRPYVVTVDRHARRLSLVDFNQPVTPMTRMRVPRSFNGRNPQMRRDLASALRTKSRDMPPPGKTARTSKPSADGEREISRLRSELKAHPCHGCPDREDHARWAERYFKLHRDTQTLERRIESRTNTIARQFDRVCDVLTTLGYLETTRSPPRARS